MEYAIALGFLLGLQHALEADHVATVASLAARETALANILRHGVVWGVGHALCLALVCAFVLALDLSIGSGLSTAIEVVIGLVIISLGVRVLVSLRRERLHLHVHRHEDGLSHVHFHSHASDREAETHHHVHRSVPLATFFVGGLHGMAGSAAVIVLAGTRAESFLGAMYFVLLFAVGSIFGMAALTAVISVPLRGRRRETQAMFSRVIGLATTMVGVFVVASAIGQF